jgi:hypothetical protein
MTALEAFNNYCDRHDSGSIYGNNSFIADARKLLALVFDDIESRAEANMLKTGKLEGMHYAALKEVRAELRVVRRFSIDSQCGTGVEAERMKSDS